MLSLAFAGTLSAVDVQPQAVVFRSKPGQKLEQAVTLTNRDASEVEVKLQAFVQKDGDFKEDGKFLGLSESGFKMSAGESRKVKLLCKMPSGKGEKIGTLLVTRLTRRDEWVETRSLHQVYFQIRGTEVARASFTAVDARRERGQVVVKVSLKNTGNIHLQPRVVAEMERKGGGKVFEIFKAPLESVLPGLDEHFAVELAAPKEGFSASTGVVTGFYQNAEGAVQSIRAPFTVQ
jgi:hypothetical protein